MRVMKVPKPEPFIISKQAFSEKARGREDERLSGPIYQQSRKRVRVRTSGRQTNNQNMDHNTQAHHWRNETLWVSEHATDVEQLQEIEELTTRRRGVASGNYKRVRLKKICFRARADPCRAHAVLTTSSALHKGIRGWPEEKCGDPRVTRAEQSTSNEQQATKHKRCGTSDERHITSLDRQRRENSNDWRESNKR